MLRGLLNRSSISLRDSTFLSKLVFMKIDSSSRVSTCFVTAYRRRVLFSDFILAVWLSPSMFRVAVSWTWFIKFDYSLNYFCFVCKNFCALNVLPGLKFSGDISIRSRLISIGGNRLLECFGDMNPLPEYRDVYSSVDLLRVNIFNLI